MKHVLAGDNLEALSAREHELLSASPSERTLIDLTKQTARDVEEVLGTVTFFATQRLWHVRSLESLRSPKQQESILAALVATPDEVLVVMTKSLTPAAKKRFGQPWKLQEFKAPASLFALGEALGSKSLESVQMLLHRAIAESGEWSVHAVLSRHFQQLLQAKLGLPVAAAPFVQIKLQKQAHSWSEEQILAALHALYKAESAIKSGKTPFSWDSFIDIWLAKHYDNDQLGKGGA